MAFPTAAVGMPFDMVEPTKGSKSITLTDPGLYIFTCKVHTYMFGIVIVDDPTTEGLDFGEQITLLNGVRVPTSSGLATKILRMIFIATNPSNWQNHTSGEVWHITYPDIDVRMTDDKVDILSFLLSERYGNDLSLPPITNPRTPGVGEVWIDTQFGLTEGKTKPGTATSINTTSWNITKWHYLK